MPAGGGAGVATSIEGAPIIRRTFLRFGGGAVTHVTMTHPRSDPATQADSPDHAPRPQVAPPSGGQPQRPAAPPIPVGNALLLLAAAISCAAVAYRLLLTLRRLWTTLPPLDDAYMFSRYADHIIAGWGMAWNPGGPQTYGCTSLVYALWITALRFARFDLGRALGLGSWLPAVGVVVVLAIACRRTAPRRPWNHPLVAAGFVCLAIVVQNPFFFHAASGMDTTLAMLANAMVVLMVLHPEFRRSTPRVVATALVAYVAFLTRPDNLLVAALLPLILLIPQPGEQGQWRRVIVFLATLCVLLALDTAAKTIIFSDPLPIPFYAKRRGFYDDYVGVIQWNPLRYFRLFWVNQWFALAVLCLAATRKTVRLMVGILVPVLLTFGFLFTATQIMGYHGRFYYPMTPLVIAAAYHALANRPPRTQPGRRLHHRPTIIRRAVAVGLIVLLLWPVADSAAAWYDRSRQRALAPAVARRDRDVSGRAPRLGFVAAARSVALLVQQSPPDVVWAMSEHGYIGAVAPNVTIIDLVGLHDRNTLTDKPAAQHVMEVKPDAIWFAHPDYVGLVRAIRSNEVFRRQYDYWPSAFDYGLAIRRTSVYHDDLVARLRTLWKKTYHFALPPPMMPASNPQPAPP